MTTDTDDRLPVPHFTANLWHELAELHGQRRHSHDHDLGRSAGDLVTVDRRHRLRGRRSLYAGAGAIAAAIALVAAVAISPPHTGTGDDELGTLIVSATRQASDERILHVVTDVVRPLPEFDRHNLSNTDSEEWSNWAAPGHDIHVVSRDYETGELVAEAGGKAEPDGDTRSIDHVARTYVEGCRHSSGFKGEGDSEVIREELAEGHYFQDGTQVVDGEELIVIRIRSEENDRGEWVDSSRFALYVDPDTYLPRLQRFYEEDGDLEREETYEYLPRTPENIAKTLPPPAPADYTEMSIAEFCY